MLIRPVHLLVAVVSILSACGSSNDGPRILRVALQTDLGPDELDGASFAFTVRRLDDDPASMPRLTRTLTLGELDPAPADLPGEGLRSRFGVRALLAEGLPEGRYEVDVEVSGIDPVRRASTASFSLIGVRDVTLSVLAEPGVTCMVDRDCAPPPCAETECWSGLCATLRDPEAPATCECEVDADCDRASLGLSADDCRTPACITRELPDGTEEQVCAADFTGSACAAGTVCAATDDPDAFACTSITCEGRAPGDVCRPAAGDCDVAELCGEGPDCPPDQLAGSFSPCSLAGGAPGGTCDGLGACVPPAPECDDDADCDDGFTCTADNCGVGGVCEHLARDSECGEPATCVSVRRCDVADPAAEASTGCVDVFAPAGAACDNTDPCTNPDRCDGSGNCDIDETRIVCPSGGACVDGRCGCVPGPAGDAACALAVGRIFPGTCMLLPSADPCSTAGTERQTVRTAVCDAIRRECAIPPDSFRDVPCVVPSEGRTCGGTTTTSTACTADPVECPTSGTRVETRTSRVCRAGACVAESTDTTESCMVVSDRLPCGPPRESTGVCGGFSASNTCDETGVATRTTIRTLCNAGRCDPGMTSTTTTSVACARDTDGDACDLDPCSPGFCAGGSCLGMEACVAPCICGRSALSTGYTCILDPRSGRDLGMTDCIAPIPFD